jgi:hypothetical protein
LETKQKGSLAPIVEQAVQTILEVEMEENPIE